MKPPLFIRASFVASILMLLGLRPGLHAATLWVQGFDSGGVPGDYVGTTGSNLADAISGSAGVTWSINGEALQATRVAGGNGSFTINGDDWDAEMLLVEMRMQVAGVVTGGTTTLMFAVGEDFETSNVHPQNARTHSDFSINFTAGPPGTFRFRDHDNSTNLGNGGNGTAAISTGQWINVWWGINNSGNGISYSKPDGTTASLADGTWDLWAEIGGVWYQLGSNPSNTNNQGTVLDDFKITFVSPGEGTVLFDRIKISDTLTKVPEPGSLLLWGGSFLLVLRRSRSRTGFSGGTP